ncbi:hypothetical protein D9M69_647980 [compost metagenome]
MIDGRRGKLECFAIEQGQYLLRRSADRCRRADDLRPVPARGEHQIECCLIGPCDRPKRAGNKMQLVLDDEVRRRAIRNTEQPVGSLLANDLCELVGRSDQQRRSIVVDVFVDGVDRQVAVHRAHAIRAFGVDGGGGACH